MVEGNVLNKDHYNHTIINNTGNGKPIYYLFNNNSIDIEDEDVSALIIAFLKT